MLDNSSGRLAVLGTVGNGGRALLYVPELSDPAVVFGPTVVNGVTTVTAAENEARFNALVDDLGLKRGEIVKKNSEDSPDYFKVDLHISQEIPTYFLGSKVKLFADVENLLNMIDSDWGALNQVAFPYTAAVVQVACVSVVSGNCTQYRYSNVASPNEALSSRQSLYQIRVGARFSF